jgi:hypothetical protein
MAFPVKLLPPYRIKYGMSFVTFLWEKILVMWDRRVQENLFRFATHRALKVCELFPHPHPPGAGRRCERAPKVVVSSMVVSSIVVSLNTANIR